MSEVADVRAAEAPAVTSAAVDRVALARAVLARAEQRTGTEGWARPRSSTAPALAVRPEAPAASAAVPGSGPSRSHGPSVLAGLVTEVEPPAGRMLPVHAGLAGLLPAGALERGSTVVVAGSASLTLALLARASREGSWVALVGLPEMGVLAAHQAGFDLGRVVLVPDPGPDGPRAVAALLDGVDVVVVGARVALGHGDRRRLSARARERSAVLLSTGAWPGARTVLTAGESRWEGLGRGQGRLRSRRLTVYRGGRGAASRVRAVEVRLYGSVADEASTRCESVVGLRAG